MAMRIAVDPATLPPGSPQKIEAMRVLAAHNMAIFGESSQSEELTQLARQYRNGDMVIVGHRPTRCVEFYEALSLPGQIRHMRKQAGYSQRELAQEVGLHMNMIDRYERDISEPGFGVMCRIVKACGLKMVGIPDV